MADVMSCENAVSIADSVKVVLGIGNCAVKRLIDGHSRKSLH